MPTTMTEKEELEAFESLLGKVQHAQVFPKLADFGYDATALAADQALAAATHTARTNHRNTPKPA